MWRNKWERDFESRKSDFWRTVEKLIDKLWKYWKETWRKILGKLNVILRKYVKEIWKNLFEIWDEFQRN